MDRFFLAGFAGRKSCFMECPVSSCRQGEMFVKSLFFLLFPAKENLCKVLIFAFAGLSGWHKGWAGLKTKKAAFCKTAKAAFYKTALYFLIYGLFFCQVLIDGSCGSAAFAHCKDYCCGSQYNVSTSPNRGHRSFTCFIYNDVAFFVGLDLWGCTLYKGV